MNEFLLGVLLTPLFLVIGIIIAIISIFGISLVIYGIFSLIVNISIWIEFDVWKYGIKKWLNKKIK